MTAIMTLPLSALHFGQDHPGGAANVRATDRQEGLGSLEASIKADGILQPLLVWQDPADAKYYVVDGSRRLAALNNLSGGKVELDVPCLRIDGGTVEQAIEKSLAANFHQLPLHPVDQHEAFAEIAPALGRDGIAARYGITLAVVDRVLALGNLAPTIRAAWRNGEIEPETAKAYTLQSDQDAQAKLFKKLGKRAVNSYVVRSAIMGEGSVAHLLKFVGAEEYAAAGGSIITDLFQDPDAGGGDGVTDRALLMKIVAGMLEEKCEALVKDGWSWASPADDLPATWAHSWRRNQFNAKKATAEQKAASGAVVSIDREGRLAIEYGVQKPGSKLPRAKASPGESAGKEDKKEPSAPKLSANMEQYLMTQATYGLRKALAGDTAVALAALAAGMVSSDSPGSSPLRVQHQTLETRVSGKSHPIDFDEALTTAWKNGRKIADMLALIASSSVDLTVAGEPMAFANEGAAALVALLAKRNAKALNKAMREAFDAAAYFDGVSKPFLLAAIGESGAAHPTTLESDMAKWSNGDLADYAVKNVPATGWLPPQLRAPCYDGPKPKASSGAKARGKKPSRKGKR